MKIAFVFCADLKFKKGLDVLYKTLVHHNPWIKNHNYDFLLLSDDITSYKNFKIVSCSEIKIDTHIKRFSKTFYKLKAFDLIDYDRVIFIDSDILCLGDVSLFVNKDELQEFCFYAANDYGIKLNHDQINSGVMVINRPLLSKTIFLDLLEIAKCGFNEIYKDLNGNGSDQTVINKYLKKNSVNYGALDIKYNTLKRIYLHHREIWSNIENDIRLLHFVGIKPWHKNKDVQYEQLDKMWLQKNLIY